MSVCRLVAMHFCDAEMYIHICDLRPNKAYVLYIIIKLSNRIKQRTNKKMARIRYITHMYIIHILDYIL